MATKLASGKCRQYRDPRPKFYGVKKADGSRVFGGEILLKQHGSKFYPGKNVVMGRDFSLNATTCGIVEFTTKKIRKPGMIELRKYVSVI